jgi:uncharacterized membrane protein HdeD (DUF308 family)
MKLDIKLPIGLLFSIFGLILVVYGIFTGTDSAMYAKSLGVNINLFTGIIMLIFGVLMLLGARKSKKEAR